MPRPIPIIETVPATLTKTGLMRAAGLYGYSNVLPITINGHDYEARTIRFVTFVGSDLGEAPLRFAGEFRFTHAAPEDAATDLSLLFNEDEHGDIHRAAGDDDPERDAD